MRPRPKKPTFEERRDCAFYFGVSVMEAYEREMLEWTADVLEELLNRTRPTPARDSGLGEGW